MSWQNQNNPFGHPPQAPIGDDEELTPPSGHSIEELSAPRWSAPHATGAFQAPGFGQAAGPHTTGSFQAPSFGQPPQQQPGAPQQPSQVHGQYSSPGFTPPVGNPYQPNPTPAHGHYTSPGFTPPTQHQTGAFQAPGFGQPQQPNYQQPSQVHGQYSSPGFTPPMGSPYQQSPTPAAGFYAGGTGSFNAVSGGYPSSGLENMTGTFNALELQQHQQKKEEFNKAEVESKRFSFAIWGGAIGAIVGVLLGVLNAILEGVPLHAAQTPLILLGMLCMFVGAGLAAYAPQTFERLLKQSGLLPDD